MYGQFPQHQGFQNMHMAQMGGMPQMGMGVGQPHLPPGFMHGVQYPGAQPVSPLKHQTNRRILTTRARAYVSLNFRLEHQYGCPSGKEAGMTHR